MSLVNPANLQSLVESAVNAQEIVDLHTHLYPPTFGTPLAGASGPVDTDGLMLWGIDELLTYHYLVAEVFRVVPASRLPYEDFWRMPRQAQADHIWKNLFIERSPISEACRGVLTVIEKLGLDPADRDLNRWRKYFDQQDPSRHIDRCMELANVSALTMTNNIFDPNEHNRWLADPSVGNDPRFKGVARIDPLLCDWPNAARQLTEWGYDLDSAGGNKTIEELRRFLREWIARVKAIYLAVSLPNTWRYPYHDSQIAPPVEQTILGKVILRVCREHGLPLAMMIGARRAANPGLRGGGDMSGKSDVGSIVNLCREFPNSRFMVTILAREDQHELCVAARKFGNLLIFGCWWFLNNPSLITEITRMRFELLGTSFVPQHSDARVMDQIIYKWSHSKQIISNVLCEKYSELLQTGWRLTEDEIRRDIRHLLKDNFLNFLSQ